MFSYQSSLFLSQRQLIHNIISISLCQQFFIFILNLFVIIAHTQVAVLTTNGILPLPSGIVNTVFIIYPIQNILTFQHTTSTLLHTSNYLYHDDYRNIFLFITLWITTFACSITHFFKFFFPAFIGFFIILRYIFHTSAGRQMIPMCSCI